MLHLRRVADMHAHVDNNPPTSWVSRHGKINAKKEADKREKNKEIERGNNLLLNRLNDINQRTAWDPKTSIMFSYPTGRGCTTKYDAEASMPKRNPFIEQRERNMHKIEMQNEVHIFFIYCFVKPLRERQTILKLPAFFFLFAVIRKYSRESKMFLPSLFTPALTFYERTASERLSLIGCPNTRIRWPSATALIAPLARVYNKL